MNYKTKLKIEQFLHTALMLTAFACAGAVLGYFIGNLQKYVNVDISVPMLAVSAISALAVIYIVYFINICLHETGHMIFGLLSGYKFNSIRFGKLILIRKDGKLRFGIYNMPGTGGQCIMTAPEVDAKKLPVVLYNLGGLIINLAVSLIGVAVFILIRESHPLAGIMSLTFAMISFAIFITNGVPFIQMGTDGANTIILYKDLNSRMVFKKQLEVVRYLSDNYSIRNMPRELFEFDKSMQMNNPLITAQAVNNYNYLISCEKYEEAKEMALYILENAMSINQLHEKVLYAELIFQTAVIERRADEAREMYKAHGKSLKSATGFISVQRALYAYYTLVEPDRKKSETYAKLLKKSVRNYPYPQEAARERELFDMVGCNECE